MDFKSTAEFSPCRAYRYTLTRRWAWGNPFILIGLNPSTADEVQDDPTIRRCINFAKREGYGALLMLNLFGFRATDPKDMKAQQDPIGPGNIPAIEKACRDAQVVVAWGTHGCHMDHDRKLYECLVRVGADVKCLGTTKNGFPKHPLYLRSDTPLIAYQGRK